MTVYIFSRETQCTGKHGWHKRGQAIRALRMQQTFNGKTSGRRLVAYRCHWCGLFHIGHEAYPKPNPQTPQE